MWQLFLGSTHLTTSNIYPLKKTPLAKFQGVRHKDHAPKWRSLAWVGGDRKWHDVGMIFPFFLSCTQPFRVNACGFLFFKELGVRSI